jgi:hypothetical protein
MFPSYVLSNLFVKGSLKNNTNGFQMKLKNTIDSGTITGLGPLTIDDQSISVEKITLRIKDREVRADQINNTNPVPVYILSEIELFVLADTLVPGEHRIGFSIHTREAGPLRFSILESLTD